MPAEQEASESVEGSAVGIGRLMVYRQLVLTLVLVVCTSGCTSKNFSDGGDWPGRHSQRIWASLH
jgi:hypothetical protein